MPIEVVVDLRGIKVTIVTHDDLPETIFALKDLEQRLDTALLELRDVIAA